MNAEELLERLREIASGGWYPTATAGPTGVGVTSEALLAKQQDSASDDPIS
jgi:hypothetical protein